MSQYKLLSFDVCPYVHRSVITLKEKGVPYDIEYIDLGDPPGWFLAASPLGKVPILFVEDQVQQRDDEDLHTGATVAHVVSGC